MKTNVPPIAAGPALLLGLVVALTGCTNIPLRHVSSDTTSTSVVSAPGTKNTLTPVPLRTVAPSYPFEMKRSGVSGSVSVTFLVDEKGHVQDAKVDSATDRAFEAPALEAVRQWTFTPAMDNGTPVAKRVSIPVRFKLDED